MKTSYTIKLVAALAMITLAGIAVAEQPSYSYVEGGLGFYDVDSSDDFDDEGYWAGFSVQLGSAFYVNGRVQRYSRDLTGIGIVDDELALVSIGAENRDFLDASLGYRLPIGSRTDLNIELGADYRGNRREDELDYRVSFGVRSRLWGNFEGRAMVGYRHDSFNISRGDYLLALEGSYRFSDLFAATLQFETDEFDTNSARAGVRLMF